MIGLAEMVRRGVLSAHGETHRRMVEEMKFLIRPIHTFEEQFAINNSLHTIGLPGPTYIQASVLRGERAYRWTGCRGDGVLDLGPIRVRLADLRRAVRFIETGERE